MEEKVKKVAMMGVPIDDDLNERIMARRRERLESEKAPELRECISYMFDRLEELEKELELSSYDKPAYIKPAYIKPAQAAQGKPDNTDCGEPGSNEKCAAENIDSAIAALREHLKSWYR